RGTQEMASFISWGNQFYTIIRAQLCAGAEQENQQQTNGQPFHASLSFLLLSVLLLAFLRSLI
ncbi:MAG: hypothetical protein WBK16_04055, partial [Limnochordia bacterium]